MHVYKLSFNLPMPQTLAGKKG